MAQKEWSDPYLYPGTRVLINKFDIRNKEALRNVEYTITSNRMQHWMLHGETNKQPGYDYLKSIHRHLFEPIYAWAGQERMVDMWRGDDWFAHSPHIEREAEKLFSKLKGEAFLSGLSEEKLPAAVAHYYTQLNTIHPFREGNGRTMRLFFNDVLENAGYDIGWEKLSRVQINDFSHAAHNGDVGQLKEAFSILLTPLQQKQQGLGNTLFITPEIEGYEVSGYVEGTLRHDQKHYLLLHSFGKRVAIQDRDPEKDSGAKQPGQMAKFRTEKTTEGLYFKPVIEKAKEIELE